MAGPPTELSAFLVRLAFWTVGDAGLPAILAVLARMFGVLLGFCVDDMSVQTDLCPVIAIGFIALIIEHSHSAEYSPAPFP